MRHAMPSFDDRQEWAHRFLLQALQPFLTVYSRQLRTLHLLITRDHNVLSDLHDLLQTIGQTVSAALLQCGQLRSLRVPEWWLYPLPQPTPTASSPITPALPHLQTLTLDVVRGVDEVTLAVLLDESHSLQELTLLGSPMPYDVVVWVGKRCHELRTLRMTDSQASQSVDYPTPHLTEAIWAAAASPTSPPAMPLLSTLELYTPVPSEDTSKATRVSSFTCIARYLVHSTPALRYLRLPHHDWLSGGEGVGEGVEGDGGGRQLLAMLGGLRQLRGLWLGWEGGWMQEGELSRCWKEGAGGYWSEVRRGGSQVERGGRTDDRRGVWGEVEELPRPRWPWKEVPDVEVMRAGARAEEEVWAEWELQGGRTLEDDVDGITGAQAFFAAVTRKRARTEWG